MSTRIIKNPVGGDHLRITTWNVNSIRIRIELVMRMVETVQPDILCLQELKATQEQFPAAILTALGFRYHFVYPLKGYNGVAVLSKRPFLDQRRFDWCGSQDARHISVVIEAGNQPLHLHNFYIPAGGDLADAQTSKQFAYKLAFLDQITAWFSGPNHSPRMILLGDLNIAPLETDVWSHRQMLAVVSHTPIEVEKLDALQATQDWVDLPRRIIPPDKKLFSWWSYRARDFAASNRGRRLDHIWATPQVAKGLTNAHILRDARGWEKPSDHVPVTAEFFF